MGVPAYTGTPQYSGTFVPEIWSGNLLTKFYAATVIAAISNTDYAGEIKDSGDKVNIRTVPNILINDYQKGMDLVIQRPESPNVELEIDKGKYFNFICDDIDKHQTDVALMESWSNDAGEQMKIEVDTDVLADIYADADVANKGATAGKKSGDINLGVTGTPVPVTAGTILSLIVDAGTCLDEQDIPESDRWGVIPAWMSGMIKKSELKDASLAGDGTSILRNGRIGVIDRNTLYTSNLLTSVTDTTQCWHTIFGQKSALSFAAQMTKMESLRSETTFGTLVRGLNVYGYKVLQPTAECDVYVTKG